MTLLAQLLGRQPAAAAPVSETKPESRAPKSAVPETKPESRAPKSAASETLLVAGPKERRRLMESYLREQTARVLQLAVADVDPRLPLTSMGIDSLMAVELRNHIEADLHVIVQLVRFLEGASLADLAKDLLLAESTERAAQDPQRLAAKKQIEQMSDEEVEALLAEKRKQLAQ
jgi:acyl carrier protein